MPHRIEINAEADLDQIWLYVARESGSMDIATRLVVAEIVPALFPAHR